MLEPPRVFLKSSFGYFSLESFNNIDFLSTDVYKQSELSPIVVLLTWKFNIAAFELSVILLNTWYLDSVHTSGQERSPGVEGV